MTFQKSQAGDVFGYQPPPETPNLHRDVLKWIQSLDLSHSLKNVRRDTQNGFMVAEIFSRYFPQDVHMHGFQNAVSTRFKKDNWDQIQKFADRNGITIQKDLVSGTINGTHGAAIHLLESLYEQITQKNLQRQPVIKDEDLTLSPMLASQSLTDLDAGEEQTNIGFGQRVQAQAKEVGEQVQFGMVKMQQVGDAMSLRKELQSQK